MSFVPLLIENIPQLILSILYISKRGGFSNVSTVVIVSMGFSIVAIIFNLLAKGVTAYVGDDKEDDGGKIGKSGLIGSHVGGGGNKISPLPVAPEEDGIEQ